MLAILALRTALAHPHLEFAFYKGELYASIPDYYFEDRANHALYSLMNIANMQRDRLDDKCAADDKFNEEIPDVHASIGLGDYLEGAQFHHWRNPKNQAERIWPCADWSGWTYAWIAPHDQLVQAFTSSYMSWNQRVPKVYWTGATSQSSMRRNFERCAAENPDKFFCDKIDWSRLRENQHIPFAKSENKLKPIIADLRKMLRYKYVAYFPGNTWSSSLKRIVAAGAVVFLPSVMEYESVTDVILRDCPECFLYFEVSDICGSMAAILNSKTDDELRGYADRLNRFVKGNLTYSKVMQYAKNQLIDISRNQQFPQVTQADANGISLAGGRRLRKVTCDWIKDSHRKKAPAAVQWQIDAWFDENCRIRELPYLAFTAL